MSGKSSATRKAERLLEQLRRHNKEQDYTASAALGARVTRRAEAVRHSAPEVAEALYSLLGFALWKRGRFHRARLSLEQQLAIAQASQAEDSRATQIRVRKLLAVCCVELDRDADALHHRHQIYLLTQQADDIGTQIEALLELGAAYLRRGTISCRECADAESGHSGAVNSFTEAIELAKRAGDRCAEKEADKGMKMTHAALQHTERETGIPVSLLVMGEEVGGALSGSGREWPQVAHGEGMRRRGVGQEADAWDLGDCVRLHSLQTAHRHNGMLGFLVEFMSDSGRWKVELAGCTDSFVNVKPANMSPASIPESDDEQDEHDEASEPASPHARRKEEEEGEEEFIWNLKSVS